MMFLDTIQIYFNKFLNLILNIMFKTLQFSFYFIIVTIGYIVGLYIAYKGIFINHGPDSNKIRTIKYNHDGKCYKFTPIIVDCKQ